MSPYLGIEIVQPSLLAFGASASLAAALMVLAPLGLAITLLGWAARRRSGTAGLLRRASAGDLAGLKNELKSNYERLRRNGEALPLVTDLWRRFSHSAEAMPVAVRREVAQAYHAIEVSNRLLTASTAYDSRGVLSIRQRRLALWPTLETAIRTALTALGCQVTPAIQVRTRLATQLVAGPASRAEFAAVQADRPNPLPLGDPSSVAVLPAFVAEGSLLRRSGPGCGGRTSAEQALRRVAAPRLALFYGAEAPLAAQQSATGRKAAAKGQARPRTRTKKRSARAARTAVDGQMALWESVA